jgi:hypothetical protein
MSTIKNLLAGLGGAVALNILHESLKHKKGTPRIDLVGEEALQKGLEQLGTGIQNEDNLYFSTLGADVVSNALYYSTIGAGSGENVWAKAVAVGLAAGVGAVTLPKPMGLNPEPVTRTPQVKALTVGYYVAGALVTAAILKVLGTDTEK